MLKVFSSLSESGFIPTRVFVVIECSGKEVFSSLSESGFIPTKEVVPLQVEVDLGVLISFREWLHSYFPYRIFNVVERATSSHLFQRVASFLQLSFSPHLEERDLIVLISFREWLHSYEQRTLISL